MGERPEDKAEKEATKEGEPKPKKEVWPKHGFDGDKNAPGALCRECQKSFDEGAHIEQEDTPSGGGSGQKEAEA